MNTYYHIARRLSPKERETLRQFVEASKAGETVPCEINTLPSGFFCLTVEAGEIVGTLSPFGLKVAEELENVIRQGTAA